MPEQWTRSLPEETLAAWPLVAAVMPHGAYLAGGTAIAVRLHHRLSRDLDVFVPGPFDVSDIAGRLQRSGSPFAITRSDADSTLNGILGGTRVQFLAATGQVSLDDPEIIGRMPVAGIRDLLATKLKVIGDRGELRDYFDLMKIEEQTPHSFEVGLGYYMDRYGVGPSDTSLSHIVLALGATDDLAPDPELDRYRDQVGRHFRRRAPQVLRSLSGPAVLRQPFNMDAGDHGQACQAITRKGRRCTNRALPGSTRCGIAEHLAHVGADELRRDRPPRA